MRRHEDYVLAGYSANILPIAPGGKSPGFKTGEGEWRPLPRWQKLGTISLGRARKWDGWGAGVGLRCGVNGLLGIDVDATDPGVAGAVQEYADAVLGTLPLRTVDHKDHVKFLLLCRVPFVVRSTNLSFTVGDTAMQVQLISEGRQFVAEGIHPGRQCPYVWTENPCDLFELPEIPQETFDVFWQDLPGVLRDAGAKNVGGGKSRKRDGKKAETCDIETVRFYLSCIPNGKKWRSRDDWMKMCHAIWGATGGSGEGREAWLDWCEQAPQPDVEGVPGIEYCASRYDTIENPATGAKELRLWAIEDNPGKVAAFDFRDEDDPHLDAAIKADNEREEPARRLLDEYCIVAGTKLTFYNVKTGQDFGVDAFNAHMAPDVKVLKNLKTKDRVPSKIFAQLCPNRAQRVMKWPGKDPLFKDESGLPTFNLWRPAPRPGKGKPVDLSVIKRYRRHMRYILGSKKAAELWMKWHAHMLQFQDVSPGWHWLVMGAQGIGKDLALKPLIEAHGLNVFNAKSSHYTGPHNAYADAHLVYTSELKIVGEHRHDAYTVLKDATSGNKFTRINPKYCPEYTAVNSAGFVLFSNEPMPIPIHEQDRRFYVVNSTGVKPKDEDYYVSFNAMVVDHWPMIAEYLYALPLTQTDRNMIRGRAPMTEAKEDLITESLPGWAKELMGIIRDISTSEDIKGEFGPIATSKKIRTWLQDRGHRISQFDTDILWQLGIRPLHSVKNRPKSCESFKGERLYILMQKWRGFDLWNWSKTDLFNLWLGKGPEPRSAEEV